MTNSQTLQLNKFSFKRSELTPRYKLSVLDAETLFTKLYSKRTENFSLNAKLRHVTVNEAKRLSGGQFNHNDHFLWYK